MPVQLNELSVNDFSGGITDYTLDAKNNQAEVMENFVINPNRKLETVSGSTIFESNKYQIPDGVARVCGIYTSKNPSDLFIHSSRRIWVPGSSSFTELVGPSSNPAFDAGTTSSFSAFAEWNEHIFATNSEYSRPIKIYKDGSGNYQLRTAGLPALASSPTCTPSAAGVNNYVYAFVYSYTYTVGTTQYEDVSSVTYVTCSNSAAPNTNQVNIASIPVLANGVTGNYDTSNVKVKIFRTIAGGNTWYYVNQVNNGVTTYADTASDTSIQANTLLYANSGVLDNDTPPLSKFVHVVNGYAIYGNIKEGSQIYKNRVRYSVQDDLDSCPLELYVDVLDEITGLSSYNDNPLVFTKDHVYRLNGQYNELGQGQVTFEDITKTIGCMSHNSIVQTRYGVFWAGNDGFYWTDGFNYKKISDSINERYKNIVSSDTRKSRIFGAFDSKDNRVYWACTNEDTSTDNDTYYILDLRWGIRDDSTFTTRTNGPDFRPTCITFYLGNLVRGDTRGYIFKHLPTITTDPKINISTLPSTWAQVAITPTYKSAVINFGIASMRKWVPKILLTMENVTNTSAQIISINDNTSAEKNLKEIRFRGNVLWGDPNPIWGNDLPYWSFFNLIEEMRHFPATTLRCSYKQIIITQSFSIIYNSDTNSTATVNTATRTATLDNATFSWADDIVDYFIYFANDNYEKGYQIQSKNSATELTYLDSGATTVNGSHKWIIKGYPKGEILNILGYVLYYSPLSTTNFKTWRNEQDSTGENA